MPTRWMGRIEALLEAEADQLAPWFVVGFAIGIASWFALGPGAGFHGVMIAAAGLAGLGAMGRGSRLAMVMKWGGIAVLLGGAAISVRAWQVAAPVLQRPTIGTFTATVERAELLVARGDVRLTLLPEGDGLPRLRVTLPLAGNKAGLGAGARIRARARLVPPPPQALPGAHDFARDAWFAGVGGVGRVIGPVEVLIPARARGIDALRTRIGDHIRQRLPGPSGAIATALATGDQSAVDLETASAMRRSGLTHLLSVSGLHIAAVVGAAMFLALRLLAMSERLALRYNLVLVAAGAGAIAGIAYTLLTGMQVPTVRSCIAALLVLAGMALGREALSIRLVATGAIVILAIRPEALMGASFQMSFAAVAVIVALHQDRRVMAMLRGDDDGPVGRGLRALLGLVLTGLAVEMALIPIGFFHFHKAGLYGVVANLVAIPLTSFLIMPLEALALLMGPTGLDGWLWSLCGMAIDLLLAIARTVSGWGGAVAAVPTVPGWAFACFALGLVWVCLWRGRLRVAAVVPVAVWAVAVAAAPVPDILVTSDGRHVALVGDDGVPAMLRDRSGDFGRSLLAEAAGFEGEMARLSERNFARCNHDACVAELWRAGRHWRVMATRSASRLEWRPLIAACRSADLVISDRRLPASCRPRWMKLDQAELGKLGGVAIYLGDRPQIEESGADGARPWSMDGRGGRE